jgi:hypothetical protein
MRGRLIEIGVAVSLAACSAQAPPPETAPPSFMYPRGEASGEPRAARETKSGPIVVHGYPKNVGSDFAALAVYGGFTKDGKELGVCWDDGGSEELHCLFTDATGATRTFSEPFLNPRNTNDLIDPNSKIARWLVKQNVPRLEPMKGPDAAAWDVLAPPLEGRWGHPEITIELREIDPTWSNDGMTQLKDPQLLIGGSVEGEAPVFPFVYEPERGKEEAAHFVKLTVLALSPDGSELGIITQAPMMEFDSNFSIHRLPVEEFAARVTAKSSHRDLP